jgi:hypothetical protein
VVVVGGDGGVVGGYGRKGGVVSLGQVNCGW